jgi:hypothetical protein
MASYDRSARRPSGFRMRGYVRAPSLWSALPGTARDSSQCASSRGGQILCKSRGLAGAESRYCALPQCSENAEKIACIPCAISRIESIVLGARPRIRSGVLGLGTGPAGIAKEANNAVRSSLTKLRKSGLDQDEGGVKIIYDGLIGGASLQRL